MEKFVEIIALIWFVTVVVANKYLFRVWVIVLSILILWAVLGIARHLGMVTVGQVFNL